MAGGVLPLLALNKIIAMLLLIIVTALLPVLILGWWIYQKDARFIPWV